MSTRRYQTSGRKLVKPKNQEKYIKAIQQIDKENGSVIDNIVWQNSHEYCDVMIGILATPFILTVEHYYEGWQIELQPCLWHRNLKEVKGIKTDKEMFEIVTKFIQAKGDWEQTESIFKK